MKIKKVGSILSIAPQRVNEIKLKLISRLVLATYNQKARAEVHTHASSIGLSAALLQKNSDKNIHPVSYYHSIKPTPAEAKYHSFELEAFAFVCGLEKYRVYLLRISFVIWTDCNSLKILENKKHMNNPRIARLFVRLSEFDFTIEHPEGKVNALQYGKYVFL